VTRVPGTVILKELEKRGWSQQDFAFILGRHPSDVNALGLGKKPISPELAQELATVLGRTPTYWLALEGTYRLSKVQHDEIGLTKRLKLYESYPVKEMIKRGWIEPSADMNVLEESR
jgi:HTH-type transcriptional regulator / antitoxin HigA